MRLKIKILGASSPYKWYNSEIGNIINVDKIDSAGNALVYWIGTEKVNKIVDKGDFAPVNNVRIHFNLMLPTMSFATKQFLKRLNADGIDETSIWEGYFDPTSKKYSVEVMTNGSVWELSDIDTLYIEIVLDQAKKQRIRVSNNPKNRFSYSYSDLAGMEFEAEIKESFDKYALINHPRSKKPIMIYPGDYTIVNESKKNVSNIWADAFTEMANKTDFSKLTAETMDQLTKMASNKPFNPLLNRFMCNPKPINWADDYLKVARDPIFAAMDNITADFSKQGSDFCAVTRCYIKDGKIVVEDVDYHKTLLNEMKTLTRASKENPAVEKFKNDPGFIGIATSGPNNGKPIYKDEKGNYIVKETPKEKPHYKFRGKFEAGKEYKKNDVVTYKNKNFICKHDVCHYMSFIDPDNILFGLWEKVVENPDFSPKPPIGIVPADIFYYRTLRKRQEQIKKAIGRYKAAGLDIPVDWIAELNGHTLTHTV